MSTNHHHSHHRSIDPVWLDRVVKLVIARLKAIPSQSDQVKINGANRAQPKHQSSNEEITDEKIINEALVLRQPTGSTLTINAKSLVTPSARDAARDRNIAIKRSGGPQS